jgi:hypothetical protein
LRQAAQMDEALRICAEQMNDCDEDSRCPMPMNLGGYEQLQ